MDPGWARAVLGVTTVALLAACGTAPSGAGPASAGSTATSAAAPAAMSAVPSAVAPTPLPTPDPSTSLTGGSQGQVSLVVTVASSTVAYLYTRTGSQPGHLWVTTDAGLRFREVTAPPTIPGAETSDPPNIVFPTATDGYAIVGQAWDRSSHLERTEDGGTTWQPVVLPPAAGSVVALAGHGARVYAVTVKCASRSHCTGARVWSAASVSGQFAPVAGVLPEREAADGVGLAAWEDSVSVLLGVGATTDPVTLRSSNAGATFSTQPGPAAVACSPTATSRQVVWLSCSTGMAMAFQRIRLDQPATGLGVSGAGTGGTFLAPLSDQVAFFGTGLGQDAGLYVTENGGRNFSKVSSGPPGYTGQTTSYTFSFLTPQIGLAAAYSGGLFRTSDAGASWQPLPTP